MSDKEINFSHLKMKPIIVIPENMVSEADVDLLRGNGLCVIQAKDPSAIKFLDPIPSVGGRDKIEQAAIDLSRRILDRKTFPNAHATASRSDISAMFLDLLIKGTSLDTGPAEKLEREKVIFDSAKDDELRKLAREEAREERAKAKAERAKSAHK